VWHENLSGLSVLVDMFNTHSDSTAIVLMVLNVFSRLDFLLVVCLRRTENQNRENQTRFFSLFKTTELPLVSLNLTLRNFDLFRDFSFSFLFALVSRPHLQARKPPPITLGRK